MKNDYLENLDLKEEVESLKVTVRELESELNMYEYDRSRREADCMFELQGAVSANNLFLLEEKADQLQSLENHEERTVGKILATVIRLLRTNGYSE